MSEDLVNSLIPAVDQQIESAATPHVAATFKRLTGENQLAEDDAKFLIAECLADESNRMFIEKREFNIDRYYELLDELPHSDSQAH
ncbi:hypothetical protein [Persicirhabdus sediminis]|uniref:Uncharacterized protein n=1 Tax=Persicirhabdus sediminis TaxID=454144 RepID=A0A8J7SIY0_9BACT|nr:hypothetical protein [Persicirhabdus sediminis]MBK1790949.1 hypothetical protein [Persicirhabdus sediminis]